MLKVLLSCEKACTLHCQWNLNFKYLPRNSKKIVCNILILFFLVGEGVMTSRNYLIGLIFFVYCT